MLKCFIEQVVAEQKGSVKLERQVMLLQLAWARLAFSLRAWP